MYELNPADAPEFLIRRILDDAVAKYKEEYPNATNGKTPSLHFYAHNAGKFDNKIILKAIYKIHFEVNKYAPTHISDQHNDIYQIVINYKGINIVFRDSLKLLLASVDSLNSSILNNKYPKLPINFELLKSIANGPDYYTKLTERNSELVKQLTNMDITGGSSNNPYPLASKYRSAADYINAYCVNDCVVIANALLKFGASIEASVGFPIAIKECITISSMAMYVFTRKFNNISETPLLSIGLNSAASSFIRKAYIGGRVEVFNSSINLGTVNHFDVPGMYALCMTKALPYGNPVYVSDFLKEVNAIEFLRSLHGNNLIAFIECEVKTPKDLNIPVLGIKADNGKLIFPLGRFSGT